MISLLLFIPIIGAIYVGVLQTSTTSSFSLYNYDTKRLEFIHKRIGLGTTLVNLFLSILIFLLYNFSYNGYQFGSVQEYHYIGSYDIHLGIDGISIYFVLLTTIIMPIALMSNWISISKDVKAFVIIILLLETLLLAIFTVLDTLLFYIFFESILAPLFILIGLFGSYNKTRASFYLFLYTLLGSLFMLIGILSINTIMSATDFDALYKGNLNLTIQLFLFVSIFIAIGVKTPVIFLNNWLLKAHVESPLSGSIILAGIILKLSIYGVLRLILPILAKGLVYFTPVVFVIGVITIIYSSISTIRTIDIKELIAYSSVAHAAVYTMAIFSNTVQGIEGAVMLGLGHGFISPALFILSGGVLYDRSGTRLISFYRGMAQVMPIFAIIFLISCLANAGVPLTTNFIGEFMSLYGSFERLPILGAFASSSIILSAAYTMFMFNRIAFGGSYSPYFKFNLPDLNKREFTILLPLIILTVLFGIYTTPVLDGLHYTVSTLVYNAQC